MVEYEPTEASLSTHAVPEWFHDAKLGIFIHWGPYSVPGWADHEKGHPYAEWYPRNMYEPGTPTYDYHRETYGKDVEYLDFVEEWTAENWDPDRWAEFFADVGARYVVLTGEHHDGFPLWPSHYQRYNAAEMGPERDIVGELCRAVREQGLRFAASYHANLNYYQPGFEGPFGHPDVRGTASKYHAETDEESFRPGPEYVDFMNAKHRELIRQYEPDMLWFDTPHADDETVRARELIADYYEQAAEWGKEVLVNNRSATDVDGDIHTPEYELLEEIDEEKWELCRGIGRSFGFNRREGPEEHLSGKELVHLLADVVSKNGNLLINVGPRADGTIPKFQREPLETLGAWLDVHGEAIYGTTYWKQSEDESASVEVRYTRRGDTLYAICLAWPGPSLTLDGPEPDRARLLGTAEQMVDRVGSQTRVSLPETPPAERTAYVVALDGAASH